MHSVIVESLEEYLSGALDRTGRRAFQAHLDACEECREEVGSMQEMAGLFGSLKSEVFPEPLPGFYAGVVNRIEERRSASSLAGLLGFDLVFGRRLVFASLMTLAILGSYLISRETKYPEAISAESVIAEQNSPAFEIASGQDQMLVTLAAYEH